MACVNISRRFYLAFYQLSELKYAFHTRRQSLQIIRRRQISNSIHMSRSIVTSRTLPIQKHDDAHKTTIEDEGIRQQHDLRMLMRRMVNPVVLITTCSSDASSIVRAASTGASTWDNKKLSPYYEAFCGATVSSFTTVTLGPPDQMVSFNLKRPSRTLDGMLKHKNFRICLLRATADGASVASAFVGGDHARAFEQIAEDGNWVGLADQSPMPDASRLFPNLARAPLIIGPASEAGLLCEVVENKCVDVGDHTIVIGRVVDVYENMNSESGKGSTCLSYAEQQFRGEPPAIQESIERRPSKITNAGGQHDDVNLDLISLKAPSGQKQNNGI